MTPLIQQNNTNYLVLKVLGWNAKSIKSRISLVSYKRKHSRYSGNCRNLA